MRTSHLTRVLGYDILLDCDEDGGGYAATVPALPGCISSGSTFDEAQANIYEAIVRWITTARTRGDEVPEDWTVYTT